MSQNDILRVVVRYHGGTGEELINTFHYKQSAGAVTFTVGQMSDLAAVFEDVLVAAILACCSTSVVYDETSAELITGDGANQIGFSSVLGGAMGDSAGTTGSIERSLVVRKLTGLAGRKYRGRVFIPAPCVEAFDVDGAFNTGGPDVGAYSALLPIIAGSVDTSAVLATTLFQPVIFHKSSVTSTLIQECFTSNLVGIQRRRRTTVGA